MDENIIVNELKKYDEIKVAYLFGSRATGEQRVDSYIDIALLFDNNFIIQNYIYQKLQI